MADDKPYNDGHVKTYEKIINVVPIEHSIETRETYDSARLEALGSLKGKRAKSYNQGVELLTDALIKFRKAAKHPHASEDKAHRHHYAGEIRSFLEQYAKSNKMDIEGVEKMIKSGKIRSILETLLETEESTHEDSKLDYEIRKILPEKADDYKAVAEYHLAQNPHIKKGLSKSKLARLKSDRETLLNYLKSHYSQTLENKLNDYDVPDKKDPKKK
jgi:hypothetical protein